MSKSEACSPAAAGVAVRDPISRPGRCFAPEGTNWLSLSSHSLPNPSASMNPVGTETSAWDISDWPVKLTGRDVKTKVDFRNQRVLPRSANSALGNHYFPSSEHPFPA